MEYISLAIAVACVIYLSISFVVKPRKHTCLEKTLPGITQNIFQCLSDVKSVYKWSTYKFSPLCLVLQRLCGLCAVFSKDKIFQFYLCFKPIVVLFRAETVEKILSSTKHIEKSGEYYFFRPVLGTGLVTSGGQKWRNRRKLINPSFHPNILEDFIPIFHRQSMLLADILERTSRTPWVDIVPLTSTCALDIICQTAMGVKINAQDGGHTEFAQALHELEEGTFYRILRPWLYVDWIYFRLPPGRQLTRNLEIVHGFTKKIIRQKKSEMIEVTLTNDNISNRKRKRAFLELLLEQHLMDASFTEDDVSEEVNTFMAAGNETTSMTVSFSLYLLGLNENVQKKVHEELDNIFEEDITREITKYDLAEMKYLECAIKETMRLYPTIPFFTREVNEDIEILNYRIKSGSMCFIFPYMLHRDPKYFPDPEKFMPERFFPENSTQRHPFSYVPFSAGARNCIGQKFALMEVKTAVANVLRRLHVTSLDFRDKVNVKPNVILRNADPVRLKFRLRQKMVNGLV